MSGTLTGIFAEYARHEFTPASPVYAALADACARQPELGAPLLAAGPDQRRPLLYLAAVQYVLRTRAPGHPLAAYLPVLHGVSEPDDGLAPALADLVATHRGDLEQLCATRATQTNEAARAAYLWPVLGHLATLTGRPLHLVELGTSAGLLLVGDRYAYHYKDTTTRVYGRPEAPAPLHMTCAVPAAAPSLADAAPSLADAAPSLADAAGGVPRIVGRTGIDLRPIAAHDADAVDWLRSCVWPEQVDRLRRLDAALAEVSGADVRLVTGDIVDELPGALVGVAPDALPVVFASHALTYLPSARQRHLVDVLAAAGAGRDLAFVVNESDHCGLDLLTDASPAGRRHASATLAAAVWRAGRPMVTAFGTTGPHGAWLRWSPTARPPAARLVGTG